jgi:hypothetical protein
MCSYTTQKTSVTGSAKGANGWFEVSQAMVYFDHPYHAPYAHTLNIDFLNEAAGPSARVAIELTAASALELVSCIEAALAAVPAGVVSEVQLRAHSEPGQR